VRYIAVNDGVDTLNKSAMDITPFRNILNEMYSADVSVKIKSAYRARFQQGKFMGTYAPYGYIKDPADHNHLLMEQKLMQMITRQTELTALLNIDNNKNAKEEQTNSEPDEKPSIRSTINDIQKNQNPILQHSSKHQAISL